MKSTFEQVGCTYRREDDYLIPNPAMSETKLYQLEKIGLIRKTCLEEHRSVLYTTLFQVVTLHQFPVKQIVFREVVCA